MGYTKKLRVALIVFSLLFSSALIFLGAELSSAHPERSDELHGESGEQACHGYFDLTSSSECHWDNMVTYFGEHTWIAQEIGWSESDCTNIIGGGGGDMVGIFQINSRVHCGQSFTCDRYANNGGTENPTVVLSPNKETCMRQLQDPHTNKIAACGMLERNDWNKEYWCRESSDNPDICLQWQVAGRNECNLKADVLENYCPYNPNGEPQADDGSCGTWADEGGGGTGGDGSGGGDDGTDDGDGGTTPPTTGGASGDCAKPVLGPISCNVDYPAVPVPGGTFDLNEFCKEGAELGIGDIIAFIYIFSLWISGITAFIALIYGGVLYITSGAKPGLRNKANNIIKSVLWGIAILFGAVIILNIINPDIANLQLTAQKEIEAECPGEEGSGGRDSDDEDGSDDGDGTDGGDGTDNGGTDGGDNDGVDAEPGVECEGEEGAYYLSQPGATIFDGTMISMFEQENIQYMDPGNVRSAIQSGSYHPETLPLEYCWDAVRTTVKILDEAANRMVQEGRMDPGYGLVLSSSYRNQFHNNAVSNTGFTGPHTTFTALDFHFITPAGHRSCAANHRMEEILHQISSESGLRGWGVGQYSGRFMHFDTRNSRIGAVTWGSCG